MASNNGDAPAAEETAGRIQSYRRDVLKALGAVGVVGSAAAFDDSNPADTMSMGGVSSSLTDQKRRQEYVTAPKSAFDKTQLNQNEAAIVPDDFGIGVYNGTNMEVPQIGSASNPAPAVHTDHLTNIFDHVTTTPEDTIENGLAAGESVAIGPGTYPISLDASDEGISVGVSNVTIWLHPAATIKLADGQTASGTDGGLLVLANGVSDVTICGGGTFDGNKANNTSPSDVSTFGLVRWGDNVSNVEIDGPTLTNSPGDAIRPWASSGAESTDIDLHHVRVEDCVEGIVWTHVDGLRLTDFVVRNMTQQDAVEPVQSTDWVIRDFLIDTTQQSGIDVFDACSHGKISDGVIRRPDQGGAESGIGIGGNNAAVSDITVSNVSVLNAGSGGIVVRSGGDHADVKFENCYVEGSGTDGYQIGAGRVDIIESDAVANGNNGISHQGHDSLIRGGEVRNNSQSSGGTKDGIVTEGPAVTVRDVRAYDDQTTATQRYGVRVPGTTSDVVVENLWGSGNTSGLLVPNGTRTLVNGRGLNSGDPSTGGQWNGYGYEGLVVYDTSVARPYTEYQYIDGAWQSA